MKKIQVLGTGCPKCGKLYDAVRQAVDETGIEAHVVKVEDIGEILQFGVMATPALVVDGEVKVLGRLPRAEEIKMMIA